MPDIGSRSSLSSINVGQEYPPPETQTERPFHVVDYECVLCDWVDRLNSRSADPADMAESQGFGVGIPILVPLDKDPRVEMVGGLITGLYPNLIQNAFFSSSVSLVQSVFGKPPKTNSSQFMGQARVPGTLSLGQAKALEPFARAKQKPWSHEPGSSKGSGTICLGQAKVEGRLNGQKAGDSNL